MYLGIRSAGGGHHHGEHHEHYDFSKSLNTKFKQPTQEEIDHELPKKPILNDRILMWIHARWAVDRDDILQNDKVKKYSAYHWFSTYPL